MSNFVYIATSLDGYIARKDGSIDWLSDFSDFTINDYGYNDFIQRVDGIVMGRKTFESVLGFDQWQYSKPVFVLSNSLTKIPDHLFGRAEIVNGEPDAILDRLRARGFNNLYVDGGKTIQSFLSRDLIDEIIITRVPIILGSGIALFGKTGLELSFEHVGTDVYDNTLVQSRYIRNR